MDKYVFNLKQVKLAMGDVWRPYANALEWWRLDEIENGDPKWTEWVNGDPQKGIPPNKSMLNALADVRHEYYSRKLRLRGRYGVTDEEVDSFYRVFVGWNVMSGMRALHVGPYMAEAGTVNTVAMKAHKLNIPLTPEALLKWSESIPFPEETAFANKAEYQKSYDMVASEKRRILEVRAYQMDKFGFFTQTYNRISKKDVDNAIRKYLEGLGQQFGSFFDASDLQARLKSFDPEETGKLEGRVDHIDTFYDDLSAEGNGYKKITDPVSSPLLEPGGSVGLNPKGVNKLLTKCAQDGNWTDLYEQGITLLAQQTGMPIDEAKKLITSDRDFSNSLLKIFRQLQDQLKKTGDVRANFLDVTLERKPKRQPTLGAQRPSTFRFSTAQWNTMELKIEIMKAYIAANGNMETVASSLNANRAKKRTKAQGNFTTQLTQEWISTIIAEDNQIQKAKKKKQNRPPQEILTTLQQDFDNMNRNESLRDCGLDSLETAFKIASMQETKSELEFIDKKTRVKLQMPEMSNSFAREGDPEISLTSKKMTELRTNADATGIPEKERVKALKSEILQELGDADKKMEEVEAAQGELGFPVTEVEQEKTDQPQVEPIEPSIPSENIELTPPSTTPTEEAVPAGIEPQDIQDIEKPVIPPKKKNFKDLLGNTLKGLIVLARDLDNKGKPIAAEEIHKIIRKYQGRI